MSLYCSIRNATLFPPLHVPPARPNTDPRCNTAPDSTVGLPRVKSSLNKDAWAFFLHDYPDPALTRALLHVIEFGANIGFSGNRQPQACSNLFSAHEHADFVSDAISTHVQNGTALGPFAQPPMSNFRASPIGCAVRRHSGKLRLINHLSWPTGRSVNDGIPDSEASIVYDSFGKAMADLVASGPGSLMSKLDLKSAFHHIPTRPDDWELVGWEWKGMLYHAVSLIFGLRSAPYIFNLFAEALHWIIARHIPARHRHYLDDFLQIFAPGTASDVAHAAVDWIISLGSVLGLRFQPEKTVWPSTCIEFLGLELDSVSMEARVPQDKLIFVRGLISSWIARSHCSLHELQSLTGYLQFLSQVIPYSRPFLRHFFAFASTFPHDRATRRIPAAVRADLRWWATYVTEWNGIRLLSPDRDLHDVYTDASGTKGLGGYTRSSWFATRCPRRMRSKHIQVKELYAVVQSIMRWGHQWRDGHVLFHTIPDREAPTSRVLIHPLVPSPPARKTLEIHQMKSKNLTGQNFLRGQLRAARDAGSEAETPTFSGL